MVAIQRDVAQIQRTKAHQARAARTYGVHAPVGMQTAIAIDCDEHAPVDHRNLMRIRDAVEQMPRPGTVDAAEEHVTVERRRKAFRSHLLEHKSAERRRRLGRETDFARGDEKQIKRMLGM